MVSCASGTGLATALAILPAAAYASCVARRRSLTSQLYRAARLSNNISAIASGNPRRVARRAKNVAVGRALGRGGFWRGLWK
jgi:hypothetical protein